MFMERMTVRRRIEIPHMAARKRFGRYKDEAEKATREADVLKDEALERMKQVLCSFPHDANHYGLRTFLPVVIRKIQEEIPEYTAKDVERFSIALAGLTDKENFSRTTGYILSAFINNSPETHFVIRTAGIAVPISPTLFLNEKHVTIVGDAFQPNSWMQGGEIHVRGKLTCISDQMLNGKLFHNDKLILHVKDGKVIRSGGPAAHIKYIAGPLPGLR
jgi:hypothetical protein